MPLILQEILATRIMIKKSMKLYEKGTKIYNPNKLFKEFIFESYKGDIKEQTRMH